MKKCPSPTGFFKVDNLFAELLTEYQKRMARTNLGIPQDNSLFWGNIKGYLDDQKDIKSYINSSVVKSVNNYIAEGILEIPEATLELIRSLTEWAQDNEGGIAALTNNVSSNTNAIKNIQNSTVYLTQEEYDKLIQEGLIEDHVEYNIYENEDI